MPQPIHCRPEVFARVTAELPHLDRLDALVRAASAITLQELPDADVDGVERSVAALATRISARVRSRGPAATIAHLHAVLFDEERFLGNTDDYYNTGNSYLPVVLETHRGLPVTLALLYVSVAERVGLSAQGINSPGHFLAALHDGTQWMYIDVFAGGRMLNREEVFQQIETATNTKVERTDSLLQRATHQQWLGRIIANLQANFLQQGHSGHRSAMSELLSLVSETQ